MEFTAKGPFKNNIYNLMRNIGYHFQAKEPHSGEISFTSSTGFPRFHVFLKTDDINFKIHFDLHLDQRAPLYSGTAAHNGEYSGQAVEKEAERIKHLLTHEIISGPGKSFD
jgi:hypothetical protein